MELKKQNILFFTRTMDLGGTENVVLQLCEIFKPKVNKIIVCSCGGVNVSKLDKLGIKHITIPDIESKSPAVMFNVAKKLNSIVKKENISIIHTHHRMAAFYVSVLGLYKKCKFFNTSHNTFDNKMSLTHFAYKNAHLIACGEMVKQNLINQFGLPANQISVIHNAVKPFDQNIMEDILIKELHNQGKFVIGNIGRLSEQKGMKYYIESIPHVIKKHPEARFLIIGSGEDDIKLKQQVEKMEIKDYIYFLGFRSDIQNIMSQIDLIVLSSLWEGLPLTPIEAFSVEKTVIATSVDGTPEIVKDNENGLLVSPQNALQIAEKINYIIEHPKEKRCLEKEALKTFNKEFSFEQFSKHYIENYQKVN